MVSAALGLLVLSPVLGLIALLVKCHDGGPVFYRAVRVGKEGTCFRLYKFRTMVPDAEKKGAAITSAGDARVTPIGRFLRRTKLDELPQLLNVVKGEMNLVGPRPEDPRYVALYSQQERRILAFRPGMTSPASLSYRNEEEQLHGKDFLTTYTQEILPRKLAMEMEYFPEQSIGRDIILILRTFAAIVR